MAALLNRLGGWAEVRAIAGAWHEAACGDDCLAAAVADGLDDLCVLLLDLVRAADDGEGPGLPAKVRRRLAALDGVAFHQLARHLQTILLRHAIDEPSVDRVLDRLLPLQRAVEPASEAASDVFSVVAGYARSLREIHDEAESLDPRPFLFASAAARIRGDLVRPVYQLLDRALTVVKALEGVCDAAAQPAVSPGVGGPKPEDEHAPRAAEGALWLQVSDFCFTARIELGRARAHLVREDARCEDQLVSCESGLRKLQRAVVSILDVVARVGGESGDIARTRSGVTAAAVRRLFVKFRRSLVAYDEGDSASVRRAVRYAGVSLAVMFGSSDFSEVRISDRLLLVGLQSRLVDWVRHPGTREGVRLLQDIHAVAQLLRGISARQELRARDLAILAELRAQAPPTDVNGDDFRRWVSRLRDIRGLDDALDDLADEAYRDSNLVADLATRIAASLARVAALIAPL